MVDSMLPKEWLFGDDSKDKVKDVMETEKACANIKEKQTPKVTSKFQSQGNKRILSGVLQPEVQVTEIQTEVSQILPTAVIPAAPQGIQDEVLIEEIKKVSEILAVLLRFFKTKWKEITTDRVVLNYINGYKILFTQTPTQKFPPRERIFSVKEAEKIQIEINK